jgi:hypothetical protein
MVEALVNYATETGVSVFKPLVYLWNSIVLFIPGLIAALVILLVGWCIAWIVGYVLHNLLLRCKLDVWMKKHNLHRSIGEASISSLIATLLKWFVFIAFLVPAVDYLNLGSLTLLLSDFVRWLPHLIVATVLVIFGLIVGDFAQAKVQHSKAKGLKTLSGVVRLVIIIFAGVVALQELGVYIRIAESTFLVLLTGLVFAMSLALGIGFGLGLKGEASSLVKEWRKKYL